MACEFRWRKHCTGRTSALELPHHIQSLQRPRRMQLVLVMVPLIIVVSGCASRLNIQPLTRLSPDSLTVKSSGGRAAAEAPLSSHIVRSYLVEVGFSPAQALAISDQLFWKLSQHGNAEVWAGEQLVALASTDGKRVQLVVVERGEHTEYIFLLSEYLLRQQR